MTYPIYFDGICTCTHKMEQHGWYGCEAKARVGDDAPDCTCEAHWEG